MTAGRSLEDHVIVALRRISRAIDLHSRDLLEQFGLTSPQLAALMAVDRHQPVTVGRIARHIHLSLATVTGILNRLEKRGLISRWRRGDDRRSVMVQLRPEGVEVLRSAPSLLQERFRRQLAKLHEWEQTQILASLQRIAAMMEAESIETDLLPGDNPATIPIEPPPAVWPQPSPAAEGLAEGEAAFPSPDGPLPGDTFQD